MERRNLDFGIEMTPEQWDELVRTAAALGPDGGGFAPADGTDAGIRVFLRDEEAPPTWRAYVSRDDLYGAARREVARFHFNAGRPFARVDPDGPDEPVLTEQEEETMRQELESFVRSKWHELARRSGIHYERGHIPQS